jgi:hypothetical protein
LHAQTDRRAPAPLATTIRREAGSAHPVTTVFLTPKSSSGHFFSQPADSMGGMELTGGRRPPLSRETRVLLMTVLISLAALWVLARIRFAERPATPNPITPVLTQLAPPPVFEQLTSAVFQVESRLSRC